MGNIILAHITTLRGHAATAVGQKSLQLNVKTFTINGVHLNADNCNLKRWSLAQLGLPHKTGVYVSCIRWSHDLAHSPFARNRYEEAKQAANANALLVDAHTLAKKVAEEEAAKVAEEEAAKVAELVAAEAAQK